MGFDLFQEGRVRAKDKEEETQQGEGRGDEVLASGVSTFVVFIVFITNVVC